MMIFTVNTGTANQLRLVLDVHHSKREERAALVHVAAVLIRDILTELHSEVRSIS